MCVRPCKTTAGQSSHPFKRHDANVVVREEDSESETNDDTGLFNIDMVASNPAPIMFQYQLIECQWTLGQQ